MRLSIPSKVHIGTVEQGGKSYPITASIQTITPEIAAEYLKKLGEHQRTLKKHHLESIRRDLREHRFIFNGATVVFDSDGMLMDAQHRLRACVEESIPFTTIVVEGVPPESFSAIDIVSKRTGADALGMIGSRSPVPLAASALLLWKYEEGKMYQVVTISPIMVAEILEKHPALQESVSCTSRARRLARSSGVPGFCHYVFSSLSKHDANGFFDKLSEDTGHLEGSPVLALRRALIGSKTKLSSADLVILFFKAWNAYRKNKRAESIRVREGDRIPEVA